MKVAQLVTTFACMLALGGCITVPQTLADSDGSVDEDPGSVGQAGTILGGVGGAAGAAGDGIIFTGGVGGGGVAGEGTGVFAGTGGDAFGAGGGPALVDAGLSDAGPGLPCLDGTSNPCTGGSAPDASFGTAADATVSWNEQQLGTRSSGCELLPGTDLCMGEGWMLADGESIPDCGRSGAYRICTFETNACVSHTVMMVQRCE